MATLGDVLSEIFAPRFVGDNPDQTRGTFGSLRDGDGSLERDMEAIRSISSGLELINNPEISRVEQRQGVQNLRAAFDELERTRGGNEPIPLGGSISENYSVKPQGAGLLDTLKRMFTPTPQPPDGMDARTYDPGKAITPPPAMANAQAQPQTWPDPPHYRPDTDDGYSKTFGFIKGDNDPARAAQMTQSVDVAAPALRRPGQPAPNAAPGQRPQGPVEMPMRSSAPPMAAEPANSELARAVRAFFAGAAGVNPTAPAFSAFSQGAAGAIKSQVDERQKDALLKRQTAKDALDETLKLSKHDRDEALADSLIGYRKAKTGTDGGDKVRFQDIRGYNEVKNNVARDFARKVDLINKDYSLSEPDKKKAKEEARAERDARLTEIEQQYKQRSLTPDMGKAAPKADAKPPQQGGDGKSPQAPVSTTDPKVIEKLPKGSYFINPADGQVYQKN